MTDTMQDRELLLQHLHKVIGYDKIPSAFWACLEVAEVDTLRNVAFEATAAPHLCQFLPDVSFAPPRIWIQGKLEDRAPEA